MEKYTCPHCGNPVDDNEVLLCLYCGESLERPVGVLGRIRYSAHWAVAAFVTVLIVLFILLVASMASGKYADLAGSWYTSSPGELRSQIEAFIDDADPRIPDGRIIGAIAPHAGYAYSGPVAGYSYKALMGSGPDKVVLVGFTHRRRYPGKISVFSDRSFGTPLGECPIDMALTQRFLSYGKGFSKIPDAFVQENSIELQVPFIQVALPRADLAILAVCDQGVATSKALSDALYSILKNEKNAAIIVSTDMCHYLPYEDAVKRDKGTIDTIKRFDPEGFYRASARERHELMCGYGAVYAVMDACRRLGADSVEVLKYANSGDTSGDKARVVGYMSAVFVKSGDPGSAGADKSKGAGKMFDSEQRKELLKVARNSIEHYLNTGRLLELDTVDPALKQELGAFVTLHKKGRLRGCIGNMVGRGPVDATVRNMAVSAAVEDPRFPELRPEELDDVDIEISVLSPMEKIEDPGVIEMGKHGVMVRMGPRSGVFLPQVADETGWSREEFMNSLCARKAGIPMDAWKTGECEIYVYTAEVFGEKDNSQD